jgi:hypothetical protein
VNRLLVMPAATTSSPGPAVDTVAAPGPLSSIAAPTASTVVGPVYSAARTSTKVAGWSNQTVTVLEPVLTSEA